MAFYGQVFGWRCSPEPSCWRSGRHIWDPRDRLQCVKEAPKNDFLCAGFRVAMFTLSLLLACPSNDSKVVMYPVPTARPSVLDSSVLALSKNSSQDATCLLQFEGHSCASECHSGVIRQMPLAMQRVLFARPFLQTFAKPRNTEATKPRRDVNKYR
jgi:hypothetical protein